VTPALLSDKEEQLRYLYAKHQEDLRVMGNNIKTIEVVQCRLRFLATIAPFYQNVYEFDLIYKAQVEKFTALQQEILTSPAVAENLKFHMSRVLL